MTNDTIFGVRLFVICAYISNKSVPGYKHNNGIKERNYWMCLCSVSGQSGLVLCTEF